MKRTEQQNKKFWKLINLLGINEDIKEELVYQFTGGRTIHSSEMTKEEMAELLKYLESILESWKNENKQKQKKRRQIFRLFYELGWIDNNMSSADKMEKIQGFLRQRSGIDKDLNSLSLKELNKVIKQLHIIKNNYARQEEGRLSGPWYILRNGDKICLN